MLKKLVRSKIIVLSTVLAVVLATTSATSVFAASATAPTINNHVLTKIWGNQIRDLQIDRSFYDNIKSHREEAGSSSTPAEFQQYLNQYGYALSQAEAIVLHDSSSLAASEKTDKDQNAKGRTVQQDLAVYLHMMRGLREKLLAS
jgi:hypothetical protein